MHGQISLAQRRRQLRFSCHVPVQCLYGTTSEPGTVIDVGEGGVRIVLRGRIKLGAVVKLHPIGGPRGAAEPLVQATVAWTGRNRDYCEAGLAWQDIPPGWVPTLLRSVSSSGTTDARRTRRFEAAFLASLRTESGVVDGELTDISLGGAAFNGTTELPLGAAVAVTIQPAPGRPLMLDGRVIRHGSSDGTAVGIAFDSLAEDVQAALSDVLCRLSSPPRPSPLVDKRLVGR